MTHRISRRYKIMFACLVAVVAITSGIILLSIYRLRQEMEDSALSYVSDVSGQLAMDIDHRLTEATTSLEVIADSLIRLDDSNTEATRDFLDRKARQLNFDSLIITDTSDMAVQTHSDLQNIFSLNGVQDALSGQNGVTFLDQQSILYSIPIYENGQIVGTLGGLRSQKNMQEMLTSSTFLEQCLSCIIDQNGDVTISPTDLEAFTQLDELYIKQDDDLLVQNIKQMEDDLQKHVSGAFIFTALDGTHMILTYSPMDNYNWVLLTLLPIDVIAGNMNRLMTISILLSGFVLLLLISFLLILYLAQKNHYKRLQEIALYDNLTNGMNNTAFRIRCESFLKKNPPYTYTMLLFNIKNFKVINSYFGSSTGNLILRNIMRILEETVQDQGIAARAEADNFFVCIRESNMQIVLQIVKTILDKIHARIRPLFEEKNIPYFFVLQSGAYLIDDPSLDITIIQDRVKLACKNRTELEDGLCIFYNDSLMTSQERRSELNGLFHESLTRHDFQVYLQPKIATESKEIAGAEALVRWVHPTKGMIYPSDFIPLFESNGKIRQLDLYVFEEVCRTIDRWRREGRPLFPIAINLSRQHFRLPDFLNPFLEILNRYQVPANLLELELTESIFFDDNGIENVKKHIHRIHEAGFSCSLDDFGSGYSSLGLLMNVDIDIVKLDRSFFRNIRDSKAQNVITATAELVHKLGAKTVAEGIETQEQLHFMEKIHCDMIQGYMFSKPLPIANFETWSEKYQEEKNDRNRID